MAKERTDQLARYREMRDFARTPEPAGTTGKTRKRALRFVIQKHAARRLHYDFRLELDGTLKSWAVPKGPSLDPADKRLAVHVEDHPLDYAGFEGSIPEHAYGAGHVVVWDRGTWLPVGDPHEGYSAGNLKFELRGEKLHGRFALVRMKRWSDAAKENWLLIKERDAEARPGEGAVLTETRPESVISGLTLDDIAADRSAPQLRRRSARSSVKTAPPKAAAPTAAKTGRKAAKKRGTVSARNTIAKGSHASKNASRNG
jgi:bifunctional non-homologous end joining protein LigD